MNIDWVVVAWYAAGYSAWLLIVAVVLFWAATSRTQMESRREARKYRQALTGRETT